MLFPLSRYISKEFGERCTLCIKTLIQHMCFKVPDRSEYRSHTAQVIFIGHNKYITYQILCLPVTCFQYHMKIKIAQYFHRKCNEIVLNKWQELWQI